MPVVVVVVVESPRAAAPLELTFNADEQISIGRDAKSMVQLPEASVSLLHARLSPSEGGYVLIDENSTNGTFLNAVRVLPGTAKPLADGDRVQVGRALLRIRFRTPSTAPATAFSTQDIALALVQGALIQSGSAIIPRLSVVAGPDRGRELVLREERGYVLGRDDDVDLKLKDEDVSRRHTSIVRRGSRLWVIDLGSKNGTRLDSRPLRPNAAEAWPDTELPSGRPESNSASARFWLSEIPVAFVTIDPVVSASRIRSGVIAFNALRSGARRSAALPPWHCAQRASNTGIICKT